MILDGKLVAQGYAENKCTFATGCLICGESIPIYSPLDKGPKICDKCKEAVMYIREQLHKEVVK